MNVATAQCIQELQHFMSNKAHLQLMEDSMKYNNKPIKVQTIMSQICGKLDEW